MGFLLPIWIIGAPFVIVIADSIFASKTRVSGDRLTSPASPASQASPRASEFAAPRR